MLSLICLTVNYIYLIDWVVVFNFLNISQGLVAKRSKVPLDLDHLQLQQVYAIRD